MRGIIWKKAASLPSLETFGVHPGLAGAVTGVHNGMLIVGGGANFPDAMPWRGGQKIYHRQIMVFRQEGSDLHPMATGDINFPEPVAYGACSSVPEGVICAGGENDQGPVRTVYMLQWVPAKNTVAIRDLPELPTGISNAAMVTIGNNVYLAGGETTDSVSNKLLLLRLDDPDEGWVNFSNLPEPVSHAVMTVQSDGRREFIYLMGGRKRNPNGLTEFYRSNYRLDPAEGRWEEVAPMPYPLAAGTGIATDHREIILFGGDKGEVFRETEKLLIAIKEETDDTRKRKLVEQKNALQSSHPGFSREVLVYDASHDRWRTSGWLDFPAPVTTTAVQVDAARVFMVSGEVRAGVRTPDILFVELVY